MISSLLMTVSVAPHDALPDAQGLTLKILLSPPHSHSCLLWWSLMFVLYTPPTTVFLMFSSTAVASYGHGVATQSYGARAQGHCAATLVPTLPVPRQHVVRIVMNSQTQESREKKNNRQKLKAETVTFSGWFYFIFLSDELT